MNFAFSIVLLFILLGCVMNEKAPCAKGCHAPLTAFYWPVKVLLFSHYCQNKSLNFGHGKLEKVMEKVIESHGISKTSKSTNPVPAYVQ